MSTTTERERLYEQVAHNIEHLVQTGTFKSGERIPSVRVLSKQMEVSVTTVLEAYRMLEDRGLIEARPQSGYYVRAARPEPPAPPEPDVPLEGPREVTVGELIMRFIRDHRDRSRLALGAAAPNPELMPTQRLNRCLATVARNRPLETTMYEFAPGSEELRVQIARRMLDAGCVLSPDDIVVTNGCQEALVLALQATCQAGDAVAVESPAFYGHFKAIEMLGLKAIEIPTHPDTGISLDALEFAMNQHPIKAVLCTPCHSNPLGSRMPEGSKIRLVEMATERDSPVIEDDVYGDLCFDHHRPHALKAFEKQPGHVLLCSSFSKTLAPGYRIGWVVTGERFRDRVELSKTFTNLASPAATQLAVAEFLANGGYDQHLRRVRRIYASQTARVADAVGRLFPAGTRCTHPTGGFVLWIEMPRHVDALEVYSKALQEGITLAPGHLFSTSPRFKHFIRLNTAYWSPRVERAIETIARIVHQG